MSHDHGPATDPIPAWSRFLDGRGDCPQGDADGLVHALSAIVHAAPEDVVQGLERVASCENPQPLVTHALETLRGELVDRVLVVPVREELVARRGPENHADSLHASTAKLLSAACQAQPLDIVGPSRNSAI